MNFYVGVTDSKWFNFLASIQPDEVNFWFPSIGSGFKALQFGEPFLFKLHSPENYIVGGGFFVRYSPLPLTIAWEAFGEKNGASDFDACRERIRKYRRTDTDQDPLIGCVVLTSPFFLKREDWIPAPSDWSAPIVRGKKYDTGENVGAFVWSSVTDRLPSYYDQLAMPSSVSKSSTVRETKEGDRYGQPYLIHPRLGQGGFRVQVTEAYHRRCAITGEKTLPVLTAAHIQPYHKAGPHDIRNGLLLRSDLHLLFDRGLLTVTEDLRVEVSSRIHTQYGNGREYYAMHGQSLTVQPDNANERPSGTYLSWHNNNVYMGR